MTFGVRYCREEADPDADPSLPVEQRGFPTATSAIAYAASLFAKGGFRPLAVFEPQSGYLLEGDALADAITHALRKRQ